MAQYKLIRKKRQLLSQDPCNCYQNDHVDLVVEGAGIRLCRLSSLSIPAEVSAYIPRVEIRQRRYENGQLISEDERIYNSITVVHAPRHPLENPPFPSLNTTNGGENLTGQLPLQPEEQPPAPEVPIEPGPDQPGAAEPPEIPSQPEPHPPPVSPRSPLPLPPAPIRKTGGTNKPVITINKRRL